MRINKRWLSALLFASLGVTALFGSFSAMAERDIKTIKKHVVVLDPGHGGGEAGAWGTFGNQTYKEELLNWKISNYTMEELAKRGDIEVHLTRKSGQSMGLRERVLAAKAYNADLLVSQHINASDSPTPHGCSVMISKEPTVRRWQRRRRYSAVL